MAKKNDTIHILIGSICFTFTIHAATGRHVQCMAQKRHINHFRTKTGRGIFLPSRYHKVTEEKSGTTVENPPCKRKRTPLMKMAPLLCRNLLPRPYSMCFPLPSGLEMVQKWHSFYYISHKSSLLNNKTMCLLCLSHSSETRVPRSRLSSIAMLLTLSWERSEYLCWHNYVVHKEYCIATQYQYTECQKYV